MDRGAGYGKGIGETAIPLVVRHAAMHVEAPRRDLPFALRGARLGRGAECVGLSDSLSPDLAYGGPDVCLDADLRGARTVGTSGGIRDLESGPGNFLLRAVFGG